MALTPLTPQDLIKELALKQYVLDATELTHMTDKCREVLAAQIDKTYDRVEQVDKALGFIKTVWRKYDCEQVAEMYDKFVKMEEALFGLERQEEIGKRYRDHFVHMFNCFVFGLRLISSLLAQCSSETAKKLFKVEDESLREIGLPFGSDYKYDQRLFYLWTLISTFHDIAIPFQHLTSLGRGISRFVEEFGWVFTDPRVSMHNFDSSQLYHYFNLLASVYGGQLKPIDKGRKYRRREKTQHYLTKLLGREFDRQNHGVLSGFFMWKTVEEIFLVGRSEKYRDSFGIEEFNKYTDYVLEQDVARAALAITLHAIEEDERSKVYPKIFPIAFDLFPLAFLLVLSDELQEYLRWEGTSLKKELKFNYHPIIETAYNKPDKTISISVSFSLDSTNEDAIVAQAKRMVSTHPSISNIDDAVDLIGNSIKKTLERKLKLGQNFKLKLSIYQDWDKTRYSKEVCS